MRTRRRTARPKTIPRRSTGRPRWLPRTTGTRLPTAEADARSEEHTSELQSLMRISYAVFCLKKKPHIPRDIKRSRPKYRRQNSAQTTNQTKHKRTIQTEKKNNPHIKK